MDEHSTPSKRKMPDDFQDDRRNGPLPLRTAAVGGVMDIDQSPIATPTPRSSTTAAPVRYTSFTQAVNSIRYSPNAQVTNSTLRAPTDANEYSRALHDRAQEAIIFRNLRGYRDWATEADIRHWISQGHFPDRKVGANVRFAIGFGIFQEGKNNAYRSSDLSRMEFAASGMSKSSDLLKHIGDHVWKSALGERYPENWDKRRVVIFVRFVEQGNHVAGPVPVQVSSRGYSMWYRDEVVRGRANLFHLDLMYDSRACFDVDAWE